MTDTQPPTLPRFGGRQGPPSPPPEGAAPAGKGVPRVLIVALVALFGVAIAALIGLNWLVEAGEQLRAETPQLPSREELWQIRRTPGVVFQDMNGTVIATRGSHYGRAVTLADLPAYVPRAFLAAEDKRFYQHGPVDPEGIARALRENFRARGTVQGGSTISQQLARTLFLQRDQTVRRKLQEMILARRLEEMLGKDGVLELYLNRTFFGDNTYGLDGAAHTYFGKPAANLTLAEAALLAAIPNAPSRLALTNDMPAALARSHRILTTMVEEGWITADAARAAEARPPVLVPPPVRAEGEFAYAIDMAARQADEMTGGQNSDLVVRLTIDPDLQAAGGEIVRSAIAGEGRRRNATQAALIALAPDGAIRAMVGGVDYGKSPFNRAVQAHRQPGSAFKPIVYAAALEIGVSPHDMRPDAPIRVGNWRPENYGGSYSGMVTVQVALARSINTVAVRLAQEVGFSSLAVFARRMGLDIPENAGPSLALGAYEVTPLNLAGAYQVFQTGGGRTTPYLIDRITNSRGDLLYGHTVSGSPPVYEVDRASQMVRMMEGVITGGTGTRASIGRPAAGKTGTSQNWRDAWFVGFTPDYLAAVWVGNDNNRSMNHVTGGEIPAQIWAKFMTRAHRELPVRDFPWLTAEPDYTPLPGGDGYYVDDPYADPQMTDDSDAALAAAKDPNDPYGLPEQVDPYAADPDGNPRPSRGERVPDYYSAPQPAAGKDDVEPIEEEYVEPPPPRRYRF